MNIFSTPILIAKVKKQSEAFSHLIPVKKIKASILWFIFSLWNWNSAWAFLAITVIWNIFLSFFSNWPFTWSSLLTTKQDVFPLLTILPPFLFNCDLSLEYAMLFGKAIPLICPIKLSQHAWWRDFQRGRLNISGDNF